MKSNIWRDTLNGMNLLLGSIPFRIVYDKNMCRRFDTMGQINYHENIIYLDPDFHERDTLQVILHELIEFINRNHELGLPHQVITALETGLMNIIMQNPHLFSIFVDEAQRDVFENVGGKDNEEEENNITTA